MARYALLSALSVSALLAACAPTLGPPPPPPPPPLHISPSATFSAEDFAWSQRPGGNIIAGRVTYAEGGRRYTCAGSPVVLTPETPWSRRRMAALYGSPEEAALPTAEVRARTASAPPGDAGPYVKRTTCDAAGQFAFAGLPDGAWYAITIARPLHAPKSPSLALMKRVVVRGDRVFALSL